jgi:hypothetical protein
MSTIDYTIEDIKNMLAKKHKVKVSNVLTVDAGSFHVIVEDKKVTEECLLKFPIDQNIIWKPSLKIDTHQEHEDYLKCVVWWCTNATSEYWDDLRKDYPDVDPKEKSHSMFRWLKTHTNFADRRKDLNLTLRNTYLGREQKWINKNNAYKAISPKAKKELVL